MRYCNSIGAIATGFGVAKARPLWAVRDAEWDYFLMLRQSWRAQFRSNRTGC